jgi:hypothetical protein
MAKDKNRTPNPDVRADLPKDKDLAQISKAWAELVEAAKTDPKARAFLEAFGPDAIDPIRQED